jgi:hypothetical protein
LYSLTSVYETPAATLEFSPLELANTIDFVPYRRALKTFLFNEHYGTAL